MRSQSRMEPVLCQSHCVRMRRDSPPASLMRMKKVEEPPNPERGRALSLVRDWAPVFGKFLQVLPRLAQTRQTQKGRLGSRDIQGRDKNQLEPQPVHCDKHISANISTQIERHTSYCLLLPSCVFPVSPWLSVHNCPSSSARARDSYFWHMER